MTCENTQPQWKNEYDPSYYIKEKLCAGYSGVPEKVDCGHDDHFGDKNIQRLCKCVSEGQSFLFYREKAYRWARVKLFGKKGLVVMIPKCF